MPFVGIGVGIGRQRFGGGGGGGFDADYQAVLDYATTQGYTLPSSGQQTLQNQLLVDLKAGGIWSKLDTFAVFATDGDIDFALIDWKRLSDYTAVNSPTFTSNQGFQGNGTSSYINSNFNPTTQGVNFVLNSASVWTYKYILGTIGSFNIISTTDSRVLITNRQTNYDLVNTNFGSVGSTPGVNFGIVTGFIGQNKNASKAGFKRLSSTNSNYTHDGSDLLANANIFLLGSASNFTNTQISFSACGGDLTSEVSQFDTYITNYITSL
jgi:hypothetical protein